MALNKTQLARIEQKINAAKHQFIEKLSAVRGLGDEPELPELTWSEKLQMIRDGKATFKTGRMEHYCNVEDAFDYPLTGAMLDRRAKHKAWHDAYNAIRNEADVIAERLMDSAILEKDGMAALDKIAAAFAI